MVQHQGDCVLQGLPRDQSLPSVTDVEMKVVGQDA
jgi:hypothetical protein